MRSRFSYVTRASVRLVVLCGLLWPSVAAAQNDEMPLGDLARTVRKNKPLQPERPVIDNENLAQATADAKNHKSSQDKLVLSIDPAGRSIRASSPDVTCNLSFNARAGALLIKPVLVEDLPLDELLKLDGPASIQDENLQLEVFNGTDWELREITVGLTLERKPGASAEMAAQARVVPAAQREAAVTVEKRSDVTLLYHLKATAKAFSTTTFKENIGVTPGPDEDWRWSIVEAKGIRPQEVQVPPNWLPPVPTINLPSPVAPDATLTPGQRTNPVPPLVIAPASPSQSGQDKPALSKPSPDKPASPAESPRQ
jgi:hypothetical protein